MAPVLGRARRLAKPLLGGLQQQGTLRYVGEAYELNGKKITPRLTFFNIDANTVRQFAEKSDDGQDLDDRLRFQVC